MRSRFNGAGYALNDDTPSGGIKTESTILGCAHCQRLLRKEKWVHNGGYCYQCDQELCLECSQKAMTEGCSNFKRQVESAVELAYRREQNARILGV